MKNIIVIGAGPAGMMAAGTAASMGASVTLLEKNHRQGRKLMITGKGRCNITNDCDNNKLIENVAVNPRFLYSAFSQFSSADTMQFFKQLGVALKTERGGRVFPQSDNAADINDALVKFCRKNGVRFVPNITVQEVLSENGCVTGVRAVQTAADGTQQEKSFECDACIIATGGCSYPGTGSTGDGFEFAKSLGHTVVEPKPSLVPLEIKERGECIQMQGLALKNISITVTGAKNKKVYDDFGELLFTHFGLSGPVVLSASSHMRSGAGHIISIDLKPALSPEQLDARIQRDFAQNINRDLQNSLGALLPKSMIPVIVARSGINGETKINSITREQRLGLVELIKNYKLTVTGFRPINEAIVTSGGVKVGEIDPKTMRSKRVGGLFFAGEVIDVDAHTGGFNLQIALSTGKCAGLNAAQDIE